MNSKIYMTIALLLFLFVNTSSIAQDEPPLAPLFDNMGDHHREITTDNRRAQDYFDQGLVLHYGFNHVEAVRSFRQAQRLDPDCAMAYWGEALSLGPHINAGMSRAAIPIAWNAIQKARSLMDNATEQEKAYINALSQRYSENPSANRKRLDQAYADAMRKVAREFPDDADAQALFGEALMVTSPWDYWEADGSPKPVAEEITSVLTASMEKEPNHPATNHFYIHTVETHHPERGIGAADRMRDLVPQSGHLQHMPSHIYLQIGRYADASLANEKAVAADQEYLDKYGAHGMYRISYMPHNSIYLCFTTNMEGRSKACLEAANTTRDLILENQLYQPGYGSLTQGYSLRYLVMARFGMWNDMLAEPAPSEEMPFIRAMWHYARGMAHLRTGQIDSAKISLQELRSLTSPENISRMDYRSRTAARQVVNIALNMLAGEIAADENNYDQAITHLNDAVAFEDALGYYEPPAWFSPARQTLGAVLLEAGNATRAEDVYRENLQEYPGNGWSLYGLYLALKAQGEDNRAEEIMSRFEEAWSRADIELTSSRM